MPALHESTAASTAKDYYTSGSTDLAKPTALTVKKLEKRRKLTANSDRLVIVLVGLPGRGKSFVARKLSNYLTWRGTDCRVFNVGKYRREAAANLAKQNTAEAGGIGGSSPVEKKRAEENGACDADFFDSKNEAAARLREEVAALAMKDMLAWLDRDSDEQGCGGGMDTPHGGSTPVVSPRVHPKQCALGGNHRARALEDLRSSTLSDSNINSRQHRRGAQRVAIFDATNSTRSRRKWILEEVTSPEKRPNKPTGVVFVESICDDEELLEENFRFKVKNSPDFKGMTEREAIDDLRRRVRKYEEQYQTITDDSLSYIKIFNLSSKLMVNHIYGRMAKTIVPCLMSWNIGTRPIYFTRAGETLSLALAHRRGVFGTPLAKTNGGLSRGSRLAPMGIRFRDALCDFVTGEGRKFIAHQANAARDLNTGTSINGLRHRCSSWGHLDDLQRLVLEDSDGDEEMGGDCVCANDGGGRNDGEERDSYLDEKGRFPFPCHIMSSTMPRSVETATWDRLPYPVEELSNLNPLDKGDFTGHELEDIASMAPEWYSQLESDPFRTRFPGGECYSDLINRLEPAIIDMEQQVGLVVVVSHVSVIQALVSYFRSTPVQKCTSIEVPLHTVIKFTPSRGGGWVESHHRLLAVDDELSDTASTGRTSSEGGDGEFVSSSVADGSVGVADRSPVPIWGDHLKPLSRKNSLTQEEARRALSAPAL